MGCTLITVICLPVLIFSSLTANMQMTTNTSLRNTELQTMMEPTETSSEASPSVTEVSYMESNQTEPNSDKNTDFTSITKRNCTSSKLGIEMNCTHNITTSSNVLSAVNGTKSVVTYRDFKEYKYYKIVTGIQPYAANIPGIITNSLTIITAANIKPLHTSEVYMIVLGSADFITVISRGTFAVWATNTNDISAISCKLPRYIIHAALIFSNMTLMAWTLERFIAVIFPIKLSTWCSMRNTKITLTMLLLLCLLLALPYFTEYDIISYTIGDIFVTTCFEKTFMQTVWTHIEALYYIYIPVVCVCACNIAILCRLTAMTKSRMSMTSNQETINKKAKENRRMTILLLTISGCFLVLHIPYAVILVFNYFHPDMFTKVISDEPHFFAKYIFFFSLGLLITEYQNVINFFLYCISGNKFRTTFLKTVCKGIIKSKRPHSMESSATHTTKI